MEQLYYKYAKMELEQFAIFEENLPEKLEEVQSQMQAQFSYDKEQDVLCCKIVVTLTDSEKNLMKADMCSYFAFRKDSMEQIRNEAGHIVFVPQVLTQFASLNYGALRGILFLKTQGTQLANYILPPVFFGQIIDKSFVAE